MTLIIHPQSDQEADFLKEMLERMGIAYQEPEAKRTVSNVPSYDSEPLYDGLGLNDAFTAIRYGDVSNQAPVPYAPNAQRLNHALHQVGGAWENDENETLDELLNMLTP